jgi:outer membrane protein OmpA-like peptidoglycan-associated protein
MTKLNAFIRLSVILGLAVSASACSTLADLDPTGLLSDDSAPPAGQFPDAAAPQASDASAGTTPDLAGIPARPAATPPAEQQQVAQSLAADGAQVQYSADALRAGNEPSAPPPGPAGPAIVAPPEAAPPTAQPPAALPPSAAPQTARASALPAVGNAPAADEPPTASAPAPAVTAGTAPVATPPAAAAVAAAPSANAGAPAVPAVPPVSARGNVAVAAAQPVSDAALGFRPSAAPPLDPSVSQFVAAPVIARYRQTAANARISGAASAAAVPAAGGAAAAVAALNGGLAPAAIVYFPGDGTSLSTAARRDIRGAVAAFKASGGNATIRVVGHSSSRTPDMPLEAHMALIFDKSQKRANAVAAELIHEGVPAAKVQVEAVGDSQPIYYESMPKGEEGNRRAEIFVQS